MSNYLHLGESYPVWAVADLHLRDAPTGRVEVLSRRFDDATMFVFTNASGAAISHVMIDHAGCLVRYVVHKSMVDVVKEWLTYGSFR